MENKSQYKNRTYRPKHHLLNHRNYRYRSWNFKKDLEKIFEPYYQGVLSDDVENLGAGLGLSLCKEMVELYSGKIFVTSEINKGTTVIFALNLTLKK